MSASKQKGTAFETAVVRFLQENGYPEAERRALGGVDDRGDVAGVPMFALECKAEAKIALASYMQEAEREAKNARVPFYAAIVKRRQKNVSEAYVVMPLRMFTKLLRAIEWKLPDPEDAFFFEDEGGRA